MALVTTHGITWKRWTGRAKKLYPGLSEKEAPIPYMDPPYMRQGLTLYRSGDSHNACRIKTGFFDRHRVVFDKNLSPNLLGINMHWYNYRTFLWHLKDKGINCCQL